MVSFHERWSSTAGKHAVQRSLMPAAGSKLLSSLSMAILYGLYSKTYHAARELNLLKVLRPFFFSWCSVTRVRGFLPIPTGLRDPDEGRLYVVSV